MIVNASIRENLKKSVLRCNARGLHVAGTWACEQLLGLDSSDEIINESDIVSDVSIYSIEGVPKREINRILFGTSLLAQCEFQRCSYVLRKDDVNLISCLGIFLTFYSQYLAGEKLRDQLYSEATKIKVSLTAKQKASEDAPKEAEKVVNHENNLKTTKNNFLVEIFNALLPLYETHSMDSYLLYLFAVVVRDLVRMEGLPIQVVMRSLPKKKNGDLSSADSSRVDESVNLSCSVEEDEELSHTGHHQQKKNEEERSPFDARRIFVESVALYPWNWSCWLELAALCVADSLPVPEWGEILQAKSRLASMNTSLDGASLKERHLVDESPDYSDERTMYVCFLVHMYLEMQRGDLAMQAIQVALPIFPSSLSLRAQIGLAQYSARDYDKAQASFEMIRDADPYRVAHIDTYSNILYIKEKHADLSLLAHTLVKVDKYAPETCCVVGNYYSLKGQHDRAITYFQRAIAVNSQYLSAWTLMGHEYIELHNSATAITCYRQALNISESDFRAWYGLGQTYEMLHLYQYASYYFRKAAVLRPGDARMWSAVGNCLLKLGSRDEAIAVFERAVQCGDSEGISTRELAKLCRSEGQSARAAEFYLKYLQTTSVLDASPIAQNEERKDGESAFVESLLSGLLYGGNLDAQSKVDADQAEALLFLATYHRSTHNYALAEVFCNRLSGFTGPEGDEARDMLKDIRFSAGQTPVKPSTVHPLSRSVHTPGQQSLDTSRVNRSISAVNSGRRTSQQFYSPDSSSRGRGDGESSHFLNLSYEEVEEEERRERLQRSSLTDSRVDMTQMSISSFGGSPPDNQLPQTPLEPRSMHFSRSRQNAYTRDINDEDEEDDEDRFDRSVLQTTLFSDTSLGSAISRRSEDSAQQRYREQGFLDDSTASADSAAMSVESPLQSTPPSSRNRGTSARI